MRKDNNYKWHFAPKSGGRDDGPNDAMGDHFKKSPYESFVREAIQNSLDAKDKTNALPIHVAFKTGSFSEKEYTNFFEIKRHINACEQTWKNSKGSAKFHKMVEFMKSKNGVLDYLIYEDYNTTGMEYRRDDMECGFYAFTKSGGNSVKERESSGGSYGYGKAALINLSKIRTILVSTMTSCNNCFFAGIASLSTHIFEKKRVESLGYYTNNQNKEEPVYISKEIPEIFRREEPGTSFYIIGVDIPDTKSVKKEIIESVIKHFWMAIYRNELTVTINIEKDLFGDTFFIDKTNLYELTVKVFRRYDNDLSRHRSPLPFLNAVINSGKDSQHKVFEKDIPHLGNVVFYLYKTKTGSDSILNFRSQHMLIDTENKNTSYGYFGVFVCEDEQGSALLKDAENPSHNQWDYKNADTDSREYVRQALDERNKFITECINKTFTDIGDEGLEVGDLEKYLSIPTYGEDEGLRSILYLNNTNSLEKEIFPTSRMCSNVSNEFHPIDMGGMTIRGRHRPSELHDQGEAQISENISQSKENSQSAVEDNEKSDFKQKKEGSTDAPENKYNPSEGEPQKFMDSAQGERISNMKHLMVNYRVFVSQSSGVLEHVIVINSNKNTSNAFIKIVTTGDEWNEDLPIEYSNNGNFTENKLDNVILVKGKNFIRVRFADNLRHSIKIKAYEY